MKIGGTIENVCECHCAECGDCYQGLEWPKKQAAIELRLLGWKCLRGRWTCSRCVSEKRSAS